MTDWLIPTAIGLYCQVGDFYVDPKKGVAKAIVSHAHADHYPRYCGEVYGSPETLAIGTLRYEKQAAKIAHPKQEMDSFFVGPVRVTFIPAGHILGSCQVVLEYNGETILYTGDIDFDDNLTCKPLQAPNAKIDWMICESTFGDKENHPSPEDALKITMEEAGSRNLLIGTYALGKAQRINRILTDLNPELKIFADRTITPIHKLYESFGYPVGAFEIYRRQSTKRHHGQFVWLLPPQKMTGFKGDRLYHKVFASGWNKVDTSAWLNGLLEISDHASQTELIAYVLKVRPQKVSFWHGYPTQLITACKAAGIEAEELQVPKL